MLLFEKGGFSRCLLQLKVADYNLSDDVKYPIQRIQWMEARVWTHLVSGHLLT